MTQDKYIFFGGLDGSKLSGKSGEVELMVVAAVVLQVYYYDVLSCPLSIIGFCKPPS